MQNPAVNTWRIWNHVELVEQPILGGNDVVDDHEQHLPGPGLQHGGLQTEFTK